MLLESLPSSMSEALNGLLESARRDKAEPRMRFDADGVIVEWETDLLALVARVTDSGQTLTIHYKGDKP